MTKVIEDKNLSSPSALLHNAIQELSGLNNIHLPSRVKQIHDNKELEQDLLKFFPEVKEIYFKIVNDNILRQQVIVHLMKSISRVD